MVMIRLRSCVRRTDALGNRRNDPRRAVYCHFAALFLLATVTNRSRRTMSLDTRRLCARARTRRDTDRHTHTRKREGETRVTSVAAAARDYSSIYIYIYISTLYIHTRFVNKSTREILSELVVARELPLTQNGRRQIIIAPCFRREDCKQETRQSIRR